MKKVFVSSTYIDLIPHRKSVWELLKNFNAEVKGMEEFGARSSAPLETCIEQAFESDIYVGIIGMRYGSIDERTGKSFTEVEYETAFKQKEEVLIYLFDEYEGLITPSQIDFQNYKKLESFKNKLKKRHTIDTFKNETELVIKVSKRIKQLIPRKNRRYYRPKMVDSFVTRFKISGIDWLAIVGYLYGMPIEIFLTPKDYFYLPNWVSEGKIIKNTSTYGGKKSTRFDFQFLDKEGYRVTFEGLSRSGYKSIDSLNRVISTLLHTETEIDEIISIIPDMDLGDIDNLNSLIRGIKKALNN